MRSLTVVLVMSVSVCLRETLRIITTHFYVSDHARK